MLNRVGLEGYRWKIHWVINYFVDLFRRNGILTDVTLVGKAFGGGKLSPKELKIPAHKLILAMHSEFFRKKFEHDMTLTELFVPSVDPDNLLSLVK